MISSIFTAIANRALVDTRSQSLSLIDIFEGFSSISFPIVIPSVAVVFFLQRSTEDSNIQNGVIQYNVGDTVVFSTPVEIDFQENNTTRLIFEVGGFLIPSTGELNITLTIDDSIVAEYKAPITQVTPPTLTVPPTI